MIRRGTQLPNLLIDGIRLSLKEFEQGVIHLAMFPNGNAEVGIDIEIADEFLESLSFVRGIGNAHREMIGRGLINMVFDMI